MSSLLLGLVPALGWGMQAIVMQIVGGKFTNKVMGMVTGNLIFATIIFIFRQPASLTPSLIIGAVLCSVFWGIGQILQVCSFDLLGVSMAMPINTAEQLIGTILFGVFYFHEWHTTRQYLFGIVAILLIIVGVIVISIRGKGSGSVSPQDFLHGIVVVSVSSAGLIGYAVIPRIFGLNGWDMLLPQAIVMWLVISGIVSRVRDNHMWRVKSWQNIITGFCFGIANLTMLLSNELNGVSIGYTLSQMNVVVSTIGGIVILHEHAGERHCKLITGLLLIIGGAIFIGLTK